MAIDRTPRMAEVSFSRAYAAHVSPDDRRSQLFGYYSSYHLAEESVAGKSWYGSNGTVNKEPSDIITIDMGDTVLSFNMKDVFEVRTETPAMLAARKEKIKQEALSKLTHEERELLGLK